jgi:hypothetical protein
MTVLVQEDGVVKEMTLQQFEAKFGTMPTPAEVATIANPGAGDRVYKAPMFRKMTDAEYEAYLQIRAAFPPRLQAIFDAAEYLSSDDEFWPALVAAAEQAYGAERAAEILAPTA